ncbi:unnamed protein product [Aphanomyces euteiches]|uniref:Na+/H+ antiporter NhaC-like C-terminal domain-containing protein n=1 Tax=Aphanomyces euteiches TaxID=100861 RepID=A0A6G0WED8_9STRA|nr:hypothetical protein Ae201684_016139 [Aphanomyces euteiches]KAH9052160.1 hypothetical protein Ae201684P_013661 [Aphanomyces euteiches]
MLFLLLSATLAATTASNSAALPSLDIQMPSVILNGINFTIAVSVPPTFHDVHPLRVDLYDRASRGTFVMSMPISKNVERQDELVYSLKGWQLGGVGHRALRFELLSKSTLLAARNVSVDCLPGLASLVPPLVTVVCAILCHQVFFALFVGVWAGTTLIQSYNPLLGLLHAVDTTLVKAFGGNHAHVLVICILLGGLMGVVEKGGGAHGFGNLVAAYASTHRRAMVAAMCLCGCLFFDDYAAILVVGRTFSRLAPTLSISQEKLAYVIHGVSACIASLVPMSSWVGVEIGYIESQSEILEVMGDPFRGCLASLPYRFFPLLWLAFTAMTVISGLDFGPMLRAERRALRASRRILSSPLNEVHRRFVPLPSLQSISSLLSPKPGTPLDRWYNALIPFTTVAVVVVAGLFWDGSRHQTTETAESSSWVSILALANSFHALEWGCAAGCFVAMALLACQRLLTLAELQEAWLAGIAEHMLSPMLLLLFAWSLGDILEQLHASAFLSASLSHVLSPAVLPVLITLLGFGLSCATGTAFGTMGILFPLSMPLAAQLRPTKPFLAHCVGAILGSCLFGNLLSPMSDDSILAALASGVDVMVHCRSMALYGAVVGAVSILGCSIPVGFGWYTPSVGLSLSIATLAAILGLCGRRVDMSIDQTTVLLSAPP